MGELDIDKTKFWGKHGLTNAKFEQILAIQDFKCIDCSAPIQWPDPMPYTASIDHDHDHCPGSYGCPKCVNAIVCPSCNTRRYHQKRRDLGLVRDSSKVMSWRKKRPWLT